MPTIWRITYALPWIAALALCLWLVDMRIPFNGVRHLEFPLDGRSPWFDPFLPGQRASDIGRQTDGWIGQKIREEPVYASLRLPGIYTKASVGLSFRAPKQPLIELGLRQEPEEGFMMQPFWSEVLSKGWQRATWQGRVGYVRTGEDPSALGELDMEKLLVWHASSTHLDRMDTRGANRVFQVALRGAHDFYAIPLQKRLTFTFRLQDMNRQRDKGAVVFSLSKNGQLLWSDALSLAGSRDDRPSRVYEKTIDLGERESGIYKLSLTADDDIFLREIRSPLAHWVIGPRLYFGDQIGYATTTIPGNVWTNARHVTLETLHNEGRQDVSLGSARVRVDTPHVRYLLDRAANEGQGGRQLQAPRGDIRMLGDGYFAFAEDLLFLPAPRRLTDASHPLEEGIRAILTPYVAPEPLGDGWYRSSNTYTIAPRSGRLRLTIGAPGLNERGASIDVRAVRLTYTRQAVSWRDWLRAIAQEGLSMWQSL